MRISHKHKFAFIAVQKTGSSSVRSALNRYSDIRPTSDDPNSAFQRHMKVHELKRRFDEKAWNWDEYFKFAFVRNPWDRLVSMYKHLIECKQKSEQWTLRWLNGTESFVDFVKNGRLYCTGQFDRCVGENKEVYIGKFENLQEDFNVACDKIGISRQELPHKKKTQHKHYTEYYDTETKEIVAEKYKRDVESLGYEFGE